jgi:RNA polymerase sigma-70 factor (ECF subfamily)
MRDDTIIAQVKNGDTSSFDTIVLKYQDKVLTLCRYLLKNPHDAEDAAQEAFLKAFRNIHSYIPGTSFYAWLSRIVVNTCHDIQRKRSLLSLFFSDDGQEKIDIYPSYSPDPEKALEMQQSIHALQSALKQLSSKLRTVIVLTELEGFSYEEIAEILDVSVGTVKSRISRARDELMKIMKKNTEQMRS